MLGEREPPKKKEKKKKKKIPEPEEEMYVYPFSLNYYCVASVLLLSVKCFLIFAFFNLVKK